MRRCWLLTTVGLIAMASLATGAETFSPEQLEFFEKRVRPILVEHCHECHGSAKQKASLRVDSRAALLKGGDSGPALVPGKPGEGYFVDAINYGEMYKMPPRGKLPAEQIATLTEWVRMGAPWPDEKPAEVAKADEKFDLQARAQHWSFQPLRRVEPPPAGDPRWNTNTIDRWVFAKLAAAGLQPAAHADTATLLRRVSFDLIGLPPQPGDVASFVETCRVAQKRKAESGKPTDRQAAFDIPLSAWEPIVDRLLASPQYGERWARHWLDLVRYAETAGHEFDFEIPEAYEYRDYVIRALNDDLPYHQFVREHLAGDLLSPPRRHPTEKFNESILGTSFFYLGESKHSPVDIRADECERVDNQVDVLGKTFLGLTMGCARCHDHKFDPIRAADYYALCGYIQSSRYSETYIDDPTQRQQLATQLIDLHTKQNVAWSKEHPLKDAPPPTALPKSVRPFGQSSHAPWFVQGEAFGAAPTRAPQVHVSVVNKQPTLTVVPAGVVHSGLLSNRYRGVLRSPTFKIAEGAIWYRLAGDATKINLIIDNFQRIRSPIYGGLTIGVKSPDKFNWVRQDVSKWVGHDAYIELVDDNDGWLALDAIVYGDRPAKDDPDRQLTAQLIEPLSPLSALFDEQQKLEGQIRYTRRAMVMTDGTGENEHILIRGNHKLLGEEVPRRFLEVLGSQSSKAVQGSGRLELAEQIVSPKNPLTARVIVNRVWKHHFGVGLVPTVDDFGHMGLPPTHPELLDDLASEFMADGWSLKRLHRRILLSQTYRQASHSDARSDQLDPQNKLLHRMNVQRLEAEIIRDNVLAVAGSLVNKPFGPSVMPHLTPFMDGRGRPGRSGPLDGEGRRSIYLGVRRNFLNPLFLAFDYPVPFATMGRRTVSNVPAQALAMLNNPLVQEQSRKWAERVVKTGPSDASGRINLMYVSALGRSPDQDELLDAKAFIEAQQTEYGAKDEVRAWIDLAHVIFNLKEFIFIR